MVVKSGWLVMAGWRAAALLVGLVLAGAVGIDPAVAQTGGASGTAQDLRAGTDKVREILRKAEAKEAESGFCRGIGWVPGDGASYERFLEQAAAGSNKTNTFKNGQNCQYDRVDAVFRKDDIRCVSYTWWACSGGGSCGRGSAIACKNRQSGWDTQNAQ